MTQLAKGQKRRQIHTKRYKKGKNRPEKIFNIISH